MKDLHRRCSRIRSPAVGAPAPTLGDQKRAGYFTPKVLANIVAIRLSIASRLSTRAAGRFANTFGVRKSLSLSQGRRWRANPGLELANACGVKNLLRKTRSV